MYDIIGMIKYDKSLKPFSNSMVTTNSVGMGVKAIISCISVHLNLVYLKFWPFFPSLFTSPLPTVLCTNKVNISGAWRIMKKIKKNPDDLSTKILVLICLSHYLIFIFSLSLSDCRHYMR